MTGGEDITIATTGRSRSLQTSPAFSAPGIGSGLSRRRFLAAAGGLLVLGAAGCAGGQDAGGGVSGGGRTIEHKYGSTQVSGTPERVVTVGITDQDPVLALGVKPVGIGEWYGEYPYATWPWAQDELGEAKPEVVATAEFNFEQIAALEPDLIVGMLSGMTAEDYELFSEIAPTVAQPKGYIDFGVPWQEQTRLAGRVLGRQDRAEGLVSDLESRFARARERHPRFEGAAGLMVGANAQGDSYFPAPYNPQDVRGRFMGSLGFEQPAEIRELAGDSFFTELSREQLDLLDAADVLVWVDLGIGLDPVKNDPVYRRLSVAREGRDVFLEDAVLNGALSFGTVLSLPLALDELVPRISAASDGAPETGAGA